MILTFRFQQTNSQWFCFNILNIAEYYNENTPFSRNIRVGTIVRPGQMAAPLKPIPWTKWSKMKWKPANRTQMKVWDDFNKSRLQIGVLVSNFEGFPGINMSKPCLSSSATSLGKPLISKPCSLSSFFPLLLHNLSYLLPFLHLLPLSLSNTSSWPHLSFSSALEFCYCVTLYVILVFIAVICGRDVCKQRQTICPPLAIHTTSV